MCGGVSSKPKSYEKIFEAIKVRKIKKNKSVIDLKK